MVTIKEMKLHAKQMVWVTEEMNDEEKRLRRDYLEREAIKDEYDELVMKGIKNGYPSHLILKYMDEYKEVKLGEYQEWLERE